MSKTDKELTVEIVKAFIESNPVAVGVHPQAGVPKTKQDLNLDIIVKSIDHVYQTIKNLD